MITFHVTSPLKITDGEGIIIDTNMNSSASGSGITYSAYTRRTLIANNIIYGNGSSAILVFASSHVDIVNNSTFGNVHAPAATSYATPTGRGELGFATASDVNAFNNILYSFAGQNPFVQSVCANCIVDFNLYFNGANIGASNGSNDLNADPLYLNPTSLDLTKVDLSLIGGSAAIDSGTSMLAPPIDYTGAPRPQGKTFDRGAFEK